MLTPAHAGPTEPQRALITPATSGPIGPSAVRGQVNPGARRHKKATGNRGAGDAHKYPRVPHSPLSYRI